MSNMSTKNEIDEMQRRQISDLRERGFNSRVISDRMKVSHDIVVEELLKLNQSEMEEKGLERKKKVSEKMRVGHFQKLVVQKEEENAQLRDTQTALAISVKSLWKMVKVLENRKKMLEGHIKDMENYIKKGSELADIFIEQGIDPDED